VADVPAARTAPTDSGATGREQDLRGPLAELTAAGRAKVYHEEASGARDDRAELAKVLRRLQPGDVLVVTRLARSTRDLLNVLASVTERGAGFRSIKDAWADTTTPHGRLMLTVLGGLAEFERELTRARTGDGRERAQAKGVRFGRPPKMTAHQRREALHLWMPASPSWTLPAPSALTGQRCIECKRRLAPNRGRTHCAGTGAAVLSGVR
jgi:Resolvase, N terminal domain